MKFTLKLKGQGGWAVNPSNVQKIYGLSLLKFARKVSGLKLKHEVIADYKDTKAMDLILELTESEVMQMEHWFNDRSHREIYIEDSTFNAHIHLDVEIKTNMETGECLAAIPFLRIDQDALRATALAYAIDIYNK
jgi:hypothetical protein